MTKIMAILICGKCQKEYSVNYGKGETDDKPCPHCGYGKGSEVI